MHVVIRNYSGQGATELIDLLAKHLAEIESLLRGVNGFVNYTLARTATGGFSVTVCQDKAGIDESVETASDWIAQNAANLEVNAPKVTEAEVVCHF